MGARGGLLGVLASLALLAATACSPPFPPGDLGPEGRLEWAIARYEQGDYGAAKNALRDFLLRQPLHPMADSAQYLLGEAQYRSENYLEAAETFTRLSTNRPTSRLADDAQYGVCKSNWKLSPDLPLDQEYTRRTVEACERLLRFYSPTPLEDGARAILEEARAKLAAKRYRTARWYYDNELFESANVYLEQVLNDYPEAPILPKVLLTLYRSYRELGFDREAEQMRRRLLNEHEGTKEARELGSETGGEDGGRASS